MSSELEWLSRPQVAKILAVSVNTLVRWEKTRQGPPLHRFTSGTVRYSRGDLMTWIRDKREP